MDAPRPRDPKTAGPSAGTRRTSSPQSPNLKPPHNSQLPSPPFNHHQKRRQFPPKQTIPGLRLVYERYITITLPHLWYSLIRANSTPFPPISRLFRPFPQTKTKNGSRSSSPPPPGSCPHAKEAEISPLTQFCITLYLDPSANGVHTSTTWRISL